jgi:glycine/D-amino acid oxidase-like deaminating enzyme
LPRASASSCVVVGAGFAGLAAADALTAAGVEVTVLEAGHRVGGRVHSTGLENGSVVELGAEFVLQGYELLGAIASRLGLRLFEKGTLYGYRDPRDGPPTTAAAVSEAAGPLAQAAGGSVSDALRRLVPDAAAREAIAARVAVSSAYEPDDQPAEVLADGAAAFGRFASHGVDGGNDLLARGLAEGLPGAVRLAEPAERISWGEDGVRVRTPAGEYAADACILAVPAPHTLAIEFDPPLPGWKGHALEAVRYGHAAKLFLPLAAPAAPSATLSVAGRFWTWTQYAPEGDALPVASSFAGTPAALERLRVDDGPAVWADAVRRLRPDLAFADAEPVLATWPAGAYSARSLSSPLDDEALARPVPPLAFAGEHTAGAWHGLMEGALRSGLRAATELRLG